MRKVFEIIEHYRTQVKSRPTSTNFIHYSLSAKSRISLNIFHKAPLMGVKAVVLAVLPKYSAVWMQLMVLLLTLNFIQWISYTYVLFK